MDEPELVELVQQFWRIESEGIQPDSKPSSPLDQKFIQIKKDSINFKGQNFETKLPRRENSYLENNYFSALSQVTSLNRRLEHNPQLPDNYKKTLQIDLERNYVKPVEMQDPRQIESGISHITQLRILTSPARFGASQTPPLSSAVNH